MGRSVINEGFAILLIAFVSSCYNRPIYRSGGRFYQIGIASYYAHDFHGRKTSGGERFDMFDLTAAHQTLPLETIVRVYNFENGKSVIVKINDRGPFKEGRIIDLSLGAAKKLGMVEKGTARVGIEILRFGGK
ncbi:MAG: septal ring lytic transglycosylase RlpA family protein [bacterium]